MGSESLHLTAFSAAPYLDFGQVYVDSVHSAFLRIHNPNDVDQTVVIEKFPFKHNFHVEPLEFTVPALDEMHLEITWAPDKAGNCRQMLLCRVQDTFRLQAYLVGSAVDKIAKRTGLSNQKKIKSLQPYAYPTSKRVVKKSAGDTKPLTESNSGLVGATYKVSRAAPSMNTINENVVKAIYDIDMAKNLPRKPLEPMHVALIKDDPRFPESPLRRITYTKGADDADYGSEGSGGASKTLKSNSASSAVHFVEFTHKQQAVRYTEISKLRGKPIQNQDEDPKLTSLSPRKLQLTHMIVEADENSLSSDVEDKENICSPNTKRSRQKWKQQQSRKSDRQILNEMPVEIDAECTDDVLCESGIQVTAVQSAVQSTHQTPFVTAPGSPLTSSDEFEDSVSYLPSTEEVLMQSASRLAKEVARQTWAAQEQLTSPPLAGRQTWAAQEQLTSPPVVCQINSEELQDLGCVPIAATHSKAMSPMQRCLASPQQDDSPITRYFSENADGQYRGCKVDLSEMFGDINAGVRVYHRLSSTPLPKDASHESSGSMFLEQEVSSPIIGSRVSNDTIVTKPAQDNLELTHAIHHTAIVEDVAQATRPASFGHTVVKTRPDHEQSVAVKSVRPLFSDTTVIVSSTSQCDNDGDALDNAVVPSDKQFFVSIECEPVVDVKRGVGVGWRKPMPAIKPPHTSTGNLKRPREPSEPVKPSAGKSTIAVKTKAPPSKCATVAGIRLHSTDKSSVKKKSPRAAQRRLILVKPTSAATSLPRHPLPSAARNVFFDERWMEKEERAFTKWLNFILTPPDDYFTVDMREGGDVLLREHNGVVSDTVLLAPTREVLSLRAYAACRKLNELRKTACRLFSTDDNLLVIRRLERAIEAGNLRIRKDKALHADLGMKKLVVDLLLSYNPQWLRLGLEVVYGELVPVRDVTGISNFLMSRLLTCPDIAAKYAHPTVPHLFADGYAAAMAAFTLKKFLLLVLFLDKAKTAHIIDYDPCLFNKTAKFKASRDILLAFSRDMLTAEGDVTRHLSYYGYTVTHTQSYLDEFDYAVNNIAVDLRDGVRLCRVMELLDHQWSLYQSLRVPASSRLQKVHNVQVVLDTLVKSGVALATYRDKPIDAKSIVDGNREHTLLLLWQIIFKFQVEKLLNENSLQHEVKLLRSCLQLKRTGLAPSLISWAVDEDMRPARDSTMSDMYFDSKVLSLLGQWCRLVCAFHDVQVDNFTVSFSDGRALCMLLHHYVPLLLPLEAIRQQTTLTLSIDAVTLQSSPSNSDTFISNWTPTTDSVNKDRLANEAHNFKLFNDKLTELGGVPYLLKPGDMSNTIPDEKVVVTFLAYLCSRLLSVSKEENAARHIQLVWRCYKLRKTRLVMLKQTAAAVIVQRAVRGYNTRMDMKKRVKAAVCIQATWRCHQAQKLLVVMKKRQAMTQLDHAATLIQAAIRGYLVRKQSAVMKSAAIVIQSRWRMLVEKRRYETRRHAVITVQRHYRALLAGKQHRQDFVKLKGAVVAIQQRWRVICERKRQTLQQSAAVTIQSSWRRWVCQRRYQQFRHAVTLIQCQWRGTLVRRSVTRQQVAATRIQTWWRQVVAQRNLLRMKAAALIVQTRWRGRQQRQAYMKIKSSAVCIQALWRARSARQQFADLKSAAVRLQAMWRCRQERRAFLAKKSAVVCLQAMWRCRQERRAFLAKKSAVVCLQAMWRCRQERRAFLAKKSAVVCLQAMWRCRQEKRAFLAKKSAVVCLQAMWRCRQERRAFLAKKSAVVCLQAMWRCRQERRAFLAKKSAVVCLQAMWRARTVRQEYERQKCAAVLVQTMWRARQVRHQYLQLKSAAIVLQAKWRSVKARREFVKVKAAATHIQAMWRCHCARKQYVQLKTAVITIQHVWRTRQTQKRFTDIRRAAIVIQSQWRCVLARRQFVTSRTAAVKIQTWWRCVLARNNYLRVKAAAVIVQTCWRRVRARREFVKVKAAVIRLQAVYRGVKVRREVQVMRRAATTLQRVWRARKARHLFVAQLVTMNAAACTLQRAWRTKVTKSKYQQLRAATVLVQARWRAILARRHYVKVKAAAINIQSVCRGWLARRRYEQVKHAAAVIQAMWRCRQQRLKFQQMKTSAIIIQSQWRMTRARKQFAQHKMAAIVIQKQWRCVRARRQYTQLQAACVCIQSNWRSIMAKRHFASKRHAAVVLQSMWRCRQVRREFVLLKAAAMIVQHKWRQVRDSRRCHKAAVTLQSSWRRLVAMRLYQQQKNAAVKIQAVWRGQMTRRHLVHMHQAATLIQSQWRGMVCRQWYKTSVHAAVVLQSTYRMLLCRRRYLALKHSVEIIQAVYRARKVRQLYAHQQRSAVRIQAMWRGHVQKTRYLAIKSAAVHIQAMWKMHACRRKYQNMCEALIALQRVGRSDVYSMRFEQQLTAAITIQSMWRRRCCMKMLRQSREAAVVIQSVWRARRQRERYQQLRLAVTNMQTLWRMKQARVHFLMVKAAAIIIQNWWRENKTRRSSVEKNRTFVVSTSQSGSTAANTSVMNAVASTSVTSAEGSNNDWAHFVVDAEVSQMQLANVVNESVSVKNEVLCKSCANITADTSAEGSTNDWAHFEVDVGVSQIHLSNADSEAVAVIKHEVVNKTCPLTTPGVPNEQDHAENCAPTTDVGDNIQHVVVNNDEACTDHCRSVDAKVGEMHQDTKVEGPDDYLSPAKHTCEKLNLSRVDNCVIDKEAVQNRADDCVIDKEAVQNRTDDCVIDKEAVQNRADDCVIDKEADQSRADDCVIDKDADQSRMYDMVTDKEVAARAVHDFLSSTVCMNEVSRIVFSDISPIRTLPDTQRHTQLTPASLTGQQVCADSGTTGVATSHGATATTSSVELVSGEDVKPVSSCKALPVLEVTYAVHESEVVCNGVGDKLTLAEQVSVDEGITTSLAATTEPVQLETATCRSINTPHKQAHHVAVTTIQANSVRSVRTVKVRTAEERIKSANIIQAFWRGARQRKLVNDRRISLARARIEEANKRMTAESKLCNRVAFALDELLTYKQFSAVLKAVMDLEKTTRLLPQCCEQLADSTSAIDALYKLMDSCNRSVPHMELLHYCVLVLLNLAKFHKTMPAVYSAYGVRVLVHLLQMYRDKKSPIFVETCVLLGLLLQDSFINKQVNDQPKLVSALESIHTLTCRKHKADSERLMAKARQAAVATAAHLTPDWSLQRNKNTIDEPLDAIVFVMASLQHK